MLGSWGSYVGHGGDTYGFLSESGVLSEFNASFSATANEVQGGWWRCSFASWVGLKIRHNNNFKGKNCFKSIGIDRQTQVLVSWDLLSSCCIVDEQKIEKENSIHGYICYMVDFPLPCLITGG